MGAVGVLTNVVITTYVLKEPFSKVDRHIDRHVERHIDILKPQPFWLTLLQGLCNALLQGMCDESKISAHLETTPMF